MTLRTVLVNRGRPDERIFEYRNNAVYTTKYTIFTFLPKFLFEQFSRYANLFFLFIAIVQQIPGVTPVNRWGTIVPLSLIIFLSGVKEIFEDLRRKDADDRANNTVCEVFSKKFGQFEQKKWIEVRVGDLVQVRDGGEFPADMVLLSSSAEEHTCYVETSNIDGETSLKSRESIRFQVIPSQLEELSGLIKCDEPNNRIYDFEGVLLFGDHEIPIGSNNILLRGSKMVNTEWIIGVVVYTGKDTKIVMNSRTTRIKRSSIEAMTNRQILYLFILLVTIVVSCFLAFYFITSYYTIKLPHNYATFELSAEKLMKKFFTFLVLLNNLVPISLIMTMEIIRIRLGSLIDSDMELYDECTDTPAVAKTTSLIEELGQVHYIFSDKTGTLTRNEMILRQLCVQGRVINDVAESIHVTDYPNLENLLLVMATCNTAVIGSVNSQTGMRSYQSSSPDEVAIVEAAAGLGAALVERKLTSVTVRVIVNETSLETATTKFKILAVLEFDSTRKRMSVILRDERNRYWIYSKGADAVMLPRLKTSERDRSVMMATEKAMNNMALIGLRTLVFASREMSSAEVEEWLPIWKQAQVATTKRKELMDQAMELVEKDLVLCGVSGVEDRLQDAVPETIEKLHGAGIRLWVLTGDKLETAVNIGYSCKLLQPSTQLLQLVSGDGLEAALHGWKETMTLQRVSNAAIVIEAKALHEILEDENLQTLFVEAAKPCRTVICCRVSPSQKAKVVEMVQKREKAVCLAIGDGANDVGMIQAAQIGVGISGKEGLQAARSADFAIAQFRFLQKLLLVHGAWGYHRISKAAIFCVYKNILLYAAQLWYALVSLFSGQTAFESWMIGLYNVVFTAWPPIIIGLTDQFVRAPFLLAHPSLYRLGQENSFYNSKTFWQSAVNGFAQSLMAFTLTTAIYFHGIALSDGRSVGLFFVGTILFAGILLTGIFKAALLINYWTLYAWLGLLVCPVSWVLYVVFYDKVSSLLGSPVAFSDLLGMSRPIFTSAIFWFTTLLIPIVCLSRDFIWKFYQRQFRPQDYHIVQELQKEDKITTASSSIDKTPRARSLSTH